MNEFYYSTVDLVNQKAKMFIDGEIGYNVDGSLFASELRQIEALGIENIDIWINSPGGNVFQAYSIFTSIYKSTATISTYCYGVAASCAAWLFLAANTCVMADYSQLMIHNPYSTDTSAKGQEVLELMRTSIATILAARTGNSVEEVLEMMNEETWFSASQAQAKGFCTEIEVTKLIPALNPATQSVNVMYQIANSAIKTKTDIMSEDEVKEVADEVTDEVKEVEEVVEETVDKAEDEVKEVADEVTETVEEIVEEVKEETEKAEETVAEITNKLTVEFTNQITNYKSRIVELETEITTLKEVENKRVEAEKTKASEELVLNAVKLGKIKDEAKAEWVKMAVNNYELAKSTLDALLVNRKGVDLNTVLNTNKEEKEVSLRELEKTNPKKVEEIFTNNRALYNQMYQKQYGVLPS